MSEIIQSMIKDIAANLMPGDKVEISGEMWEVLHHAVRLDNPHPVQMSLATQDRACGKIVLTSLVFPYRRAPRDCEDGPADNVKYLGTTENGMQYTP